jgi:hypothetical protein
VRRPRCFRRADVDLAPRQINVLVGQRNGLAGPDTGPAEEIEHDLLSRHGCGDGSTVPVKFQLKTAEWHHGAMERDQRSPCVADATSSFGNERRAERNGPHRRRYPGGAFRWDSTAQQWIYNWSTKGFKTGALRLAVIKGGADFPVTIGLS